MGKPGQQLIAEPSCCGNASLGVPDCCLIGLAACGFMNSYSLHEPTIARKSASTSCNEQVTAVPALISPTRWAISASHAPAISPSPASASPAKALSYSEFASRICWSSGNS